MDDSIFDDVDAILSEDETHDEDKNFNESELQDIMSEIENLEKEFANEEHNDVPETGMTLQEAIDAEMMSMNAPTEVVEQEVHEEAEAVVMDLIKPSAVEKIMSTPVSTEIPKSDKSEVSFQAHGQMSFNLDFKIGMDTAKLTVDPVKGLMVTVAGVEFCINEESGCTVSMENGMKFTIPLSNQMNSPKKKAA